MAEPLLSEDTDLTRLIARIRDEHGDSATIIYHDSVRRGGLLGFFAQEVHRVAYKLDDVEGTSAPDAERQTAPDGERQAAPDGERQTTSAELTSSAAIDALIGAADSADGPTAPSSALARSGDQVDDFARILRQSLEADQVAADNVVSGIATTPAAPSTVFTAAPSTPALSAPSWFDTVDFPTLAAVAPVSEAGPHETQQRPTQQRPTQQPRTEQSRTEQSRTELSRTEQRRAARRHAAESARRVAESAAAQRATPSSGPGLASVTPITSSPARSRLEFLLELRQLGVPSDLSPAGHAHDLYQAVEEVLAELPPAPELPRGAGEVTALVGPLTPALATAASLAVQLRIPESEIWIAGLAGHPAGRLIDGSWTRSISGIGEARLLRSDLRASQGPSLVVIATDTIDATPDDPWGAELVAALEPTATWLLIDATSKAEDAQRVLGAIPGVEALAVHSVRATTSPATVWDLGLPIALIDGRRADTFAWSTVLFGALRSTRRHRASA